MRVVGLTGGIAMGKSTIAAQFANAGAKVSSADDIVHQLLGEGGRAVAKVAKRFPEALVGTKIDRSVLGRIVFQDSQALAELEAILHPMVRAEEMRFVRACRKQKAALCVLEIPLLFEAQAENRCDKVVVVTAPAAIQRRRALARRGMSEEKFRAILARQMPDSQKRQRADYVIHTSLGKASSLRQVQQIMKELACVK